MLPSEFECVVYSVDNGVCTLRVNRPEQRNAFTPRTYGEIKWGIRNAVSDARVDIIVLTGTGESFGTGGDLKETLAKVESNGVFGMYEATENLPWWDLRDCPKTTIAAINGYCYAGGLIAAGLCDLSVAVASAKFALTQAKVGICDSVAPMTFFGRVPSPKLRYLLYTGKPIDAKTAEQWNLVGEVVADGELDRRVREIVDEVRRTSPLSREMYKRYLTEAMPRPLNHGANPSFESGDLILEGLTAFTEKRDADYTRSRGEGD